MLNTFFSAKHGPRKSAVMSDESQQSVMLSSLESKIAELEQQRLSEIESKLVQLTQYLDVIRTECVDLIPPPPKHLQERVVGVYSPNFILSGDKTYQSFVSLLDSIGKTFDEFQTVLDFGCGCGRVIRAMKRHKPDINFHGADIDAEAISWLQANYARIGEFRSLPYRPPCSYEDDSFDFIYGISVFTHLPEDMQFEWLEELARIAKPGAVILLTTHGQKHWSAFENPELTIMEEKGFHYRDVPTTEGLPDFYKNTYHSHDYIQQHWSKFFEIVNIIELGLDNHQDVVLARCS